MNAFSPLDRFALAPMALLAQMGTPLAQQPEQWRFLTSTNLVDSPLGNAFSAFLVMLWVALVFFHLGTRAGRRQARHNRIATQQRHIQTLERIWQLSAKRND